MQNSPPEKIQKTEKTIKAYVDRKLYKHKGK